MSHTKTLLALAFASVGIFSSNTSSAMCSHDRQTCDTDAETKCNKRPTCQWDDASNACRCGLPTTTTRLHPTFYILGLVYSPPGNASTVSYQQSTSTGSRVEIVNTAKKSLVINAEVQSVELEYKHTIGSKDGRSFEQHQSVGAGIEYGSTSDPLAWSNDQYGLWFNAEIVLNDHGDGTVSQSVRSTNGAPAVVEYFTVEELTGWAPVPARKKALFAQLTSADIASILSTHRNYNDFVSCVASRLHACNAPMTASNRFAYVDTVQLDGPDNPNNGPLTHTLTIGYDASKGNIKGYSYGNSLSALLGVKFTLGPIDFGLKTGGEWEWEMENTTETSAGVQKEANIGLASATLCYHRSVKIWYDAMFASYFFEPINGGTDSCDTAAPISGVAYDAAGKLAANRRVDVRLSDGSHRLAFSNAQGIYRVFDTTASTTSVQLTGGGTVQEMSTGKSSPVECNGAVCRPVEQ
jgi:hypothetical protein